MSGSASAISIGTSGSRISEFDAIVNVMNSYTEGVRTGSSALIKPAFHEGCTFYGHYDGTLLAGRYRCSSTGLTPTGLPQHPVPGHKCGRPRHHRVGKHGGRKHDGQTRRRLRSHAVRPLPTYQSGRELAHIPKVISLAHEGLGQRAVAEQRRRTLRDRVTFCINTVALYTLSNRGFDLFRRVTDFDLILQHPSIGRQILVIHSVVVVPKARSYQCFPAMQERFFDRNDDSSLAECARLLPSRKAPRDRKSPWLYH